MDKGKVYRTLGDFLPISGKKILVRADLNTSMIDGKPELSERIRAHAETIKKLCKQKAAVVVIAHQGRPGEKDFTSLEKHAKLMNKLVKISFAKDVIGKKAINAIYKLKPGQALLLDNVRLLKEEFEPFDENKFISTLAPFFDLFILDALSVAHRNEASVTGFAERLPSCMGPVMEKEVSNINKLVAKIEKPYSICLGGLKLNDYFGLMEYSLKKGLASKVLTCGAMGELFLMAKGKRLGEKEKFLKAKGLLALLPKAREMARKYSAKIEIPIDVAVDNNGRLELPASQLPSKCMIYDIGSKTAYRYAEIIRKSASIFLKGTPGAYEKKGFDLGTKTILSAIASSKGFSLIGGGDSAAALDYFRIKRKDAGYISLSGGALLKYMAGEKLPGLGVLLKK